VPEADLQNYSVHSFRIYVACALLAAKAPRWPGGERCACRALAEMELASGVAPQMRAETPLFGPRPGEEFSHSQVESARATPASSSTSGSGNGASSAVSCAGWAALAAYQPPELGVRFPVATLSEARSIPVIRAAL